MNKYLPSIGQKNLLLFLTTLIVAFCSIVYELIFSQVLTNVFGGTVLRYSTTIGLYLFSLGIGSFIYGFLKNKTPTKNFYYLEVLLAILGPLGVFYIIGINSFNLAINETILLILSHIPVVLVGILSGLELPFLSNLLEKRKNGFSETLGMDYFGSLVGTLIYAIVLYPYLGLVGSVVIVGLLNAIVAVAITSYFHKFFKLFQLIGIIVLFTYIVCLINIETIEEEVQSFYLGEQIDSHYTSLGAPVYNIDVENVEITKYQQIVKYNITYDTIGEKQKDECINLDTLIQICDSWANSYHHSIVDVPIATLNKTNHLDVLVLGGGDFVAVNYLKKYSGVSIDLVDFDEEFQEYAKNDSLIKKYHDNSYKFENLTIYREDALKYLRNNKKKYDLIIYDLPGLNNDNLLHLYSEEFFTFSRYSLKKNGIFSMWVYNREDNLKHRKILDNTLKNSGFNKKLEYRGYKTHKETGDIYEQDYFMILTKNNKIKKIHTQINNYTDKYKEKYSNLTWDSLILNKSIKPNSLFKPNLEMVIDTK